MASRVRVQAPPSTASVVNDLLGDLEHKAAQLLEHGAYLDDITPEEVKYGVREFGEPPEEGLNAGLELFSHTEQQRVMATLVLWLARESREREL